MKIYCATLSYPVSEGILHHDEAFTHALQRLEDRGAQVVSATKSLRVDTSSLLAGRIIADLFVVYRASDEVKRLAELAKP